MQRPWLLCVAAAFQSPVAPLGARVWVPARPRGAFRQEPLTVGATGAGFAPQSFARGPSPRPVSGASAVAGAAFAAGGFALASLAAAAAVSGAARRQGAPRMVAEAFKTPELNPENHVGLSDLSETGRPEGSHGTGFHFMPLSSMDKGSSPALVCIAGMFPGLTADDLLRPVPLPVAPNGKWNYHVLSGEASTSGFVCLPGSPQLDMNPNVVGVVCQGRSLGLEFADGNDHEVIALIDRGDAATFGLDAFDKDKFYAFADESGAVHIRWLDAVPPGWRILGRMLYTQMPFVKKPGAGSGEGGFAEMSDEFEF